MNEHIFSLFFLVASQSAAQRGDYVKAEAHGKSAKAASIASIVIGIISVVVIVLCYVGLVLGLFTSVATVTR